MFQRAKRSFRVSRASLTAPGSGTAARSRRLRRPLVTVVASVAAVVLVAVAIPPSRDAVLDALGVGSGSNGSGATEHSAVRRPHPAPPPTTVPLPAVLSLDLASARAAVGFPIGVPGPAGVVPTKVVIDRRVPGGLVVLEYPAFNVVEVASPPNAAADLAPTIAAERDVRIMSVRGRPALWITGTHQEIPYLDRDGILRRGVTRATGHVLLWEENGVTYRVEGFDNEASARAMATSIS